MIYFSYLCVKFTYFCHFTAAFTAKTGVSTGRFSAKRANLAALLRIFGSKALVKAFSDEADHIARKTNDGYNNSGKIKQCEDDVVP